MESIKSVYSKNSKNPSSDKLESLSYLERAFSFYASYHNNFVNQIIHIFCVWPILISSLLFLTYTPTFITIDPNIGPFLNSNFGLKFSPIIDINFCLLTSLYYGIFYLIIELPGVVGILSSLLVLISYHWVYYLNQMYPSSWKYGIIINVSCWVAQIFGHHAFEGRSPALLDNLYQAFVMAPLFVIMEVFFYFGYRPNFKSRIDKIVATNIAKFKSEKKSS